MHHFAYRDGVLHAEDVSLKVIAEDVGTPFYCYSTATLKRHYRVFDEAFAGLEHLICYSLKANSNQAVIATLAQLGAGADVVSEGELRRALAAKIPAEKIVFSGVGKTARELAFGLDAGIACFNVESEPELALLSEIASARGAEARISIRINPDVDAKTHAKIATGRKENKFGIDWKAAHESLLEAITDDKRRERMREGTDIFRVLIKTLVKAGIITDRTRSFYSMYVDMDELKAEGDHMIGDDIAAEGIKYLQTVNFGTAKSASGAALLAAE